MTGLIWLGVPQMNFIRKTVTLGYKGYINVSVTNGLKKIKSDFRLFYPEDRAAGSSNISLPQIS
jgi:hypothetical protein